ncbi:MAG: GNAT family N-acetyltransferase [bacterium]|nr:GNAT family N-acetyltransferase [bacterium]
MPETAEPPWVIRPATARDSDALLRWRNDPTNFQWFLAASPVRIEEHRIWLTERLARDEPALWVLDIDGVAGGTVRIDEDSASSAFASIVVDPALRGRGYGRRLLAFLDAQARTLGVVELRALIHPENVASQVLFTVAGYHEEPADPAGFSTYVRSLTSA